MGDWPAATFGMGQPCFCDEGLGIEHVHLSKGRIEWRWENADPVPFWKFDDPTDIKVVVDWKQYAKEMAQVATTLETTYDWLRGMAG